MTIESSSRIRNIQALRFAAALSVVIFHTVPHFRAAGGSLSVPDFKYGMSGVDLFFVISGYVSALTTERRSGLSDAFRYASKRFLRIFSGYLPWALMMAVILWVFARSEFDQKDLLKSILLIPQGFSSSTNPVAWTLSLELWFYVIFACILSLPRQRAVVLWSYLIAAVLIFQAWDPDLIVASFLFSPYLLEFLAGAALFTFLKKYSDVSLYSLTVVFAGTLIISVAYNFGGNVTLVRVFTAGVCSVFVVAFAVILERRNWVAPALFVRLGDSSYTLYLLHNTVLALVGYTFRNSVSGLPGAFYFSLVVAMIAASHAWWLVYEQKVYLLLAGRLTFLGSFKLRSLRSKKMVAIRLLSILVLVLVLASALSRPFGSDATSNARLIFDISRSDEGGFIVRNADWSRIGDGGIALSSGDDPMIVIDLKGELQYCDAFSVSVRLLSQSDGFAQLFFLPRGARNFSELNSKTIALAGGSEEQKLNFVIHGDLGFEGALRFDPVSDSESSKVSELEVGCIGE